MSNTVWLWNSIFLFLVAYIFYAYTLFSKEGVDKTIISLFLGESMLMALAFGFCVLSLQGIALRFTIGFLLIAAMAFGLAIVLIARHARDHH